MRVLPAHAAARNPASGPCPHRRAPIYQPAGIVHCIQVPGRIDAAATQAFLTQHGMMYVRLHSGSAAGGSSGGTAVVDTPAAGGGAARMGPRGVPMQQHAAAAAGLPEAGSGGEGPPASPAHGVSAATQLDTGTGAIMAGGSGQQQAQTAAAGAPQQAAGAAAPPHLSCQWEEGSDVVPALEAGRCGPPPGAAGAATERPVAPPAGTALGAGGSIAGSAGAHQIEAGHAHQLSAVGEAGVAPPPQGAGAPPTSPGWRQHRPPSSPVQQGQPGGGAGASSGISGTGMGAPLSDTAVAAACCGSEQQGSGVPGAADAVGGAGALSAASGGEQESPAGAPAAAAAEGQEPAVPAKAEVGAAAGTEIAAQPQGLAAAARGEGGGARALGTAVAAAAATEAAAVLAATVEEPLTGQVINGASLAGG
jgi:hypothetical protein